MATSVTLFENAACVLKAAREFLFSEPVRHNLLLTFLEARARHPEPGRYWVASRNGCVVGVVFQSPLTYPAMVTPMEPEIAAAVADSIADEGITMPGVNGEAATSARFAGQWSERAKRGAVPIQGLRLYELGALERMTPASGELRQAVADDRLLVLEWVLGFHKAVGEILPNAEAHVSRLLAAGRAWVWDDGGAKSMAIASHPVAGVVRIQGVYTPPENRRLGYAGACVHALSRLLREDDYRCVLYTDLGNPTSNSIYRRIGYRAVAEVVRYRFD